MIEDLFSDGKSEQESPLLVPSWQVPTRRKELDPRLVNIDHFTVKVPSLRAVGDKTLREAYQRFEEFGVVVFSCKNTLDLKHGLLGLCGYFGQMVFHPRSGKTGISSVRNAIVPGKKVLQRAKEQAQLKKEKT